MPLPAKPKRKKEEPERINLDDWGNAGALDGLLSFLNIAPDQAPVNQGPRKVLNLLEHRIQERAQNETGTVSKSGSLPVIDADPVIPTIELGASNQAAALAPAIPDALDPTPQTPITNTLPVIDTQPWNHPKQATGFGNKKLYRCILAQDGHSHTEEALYQVLWRSGKQESDDTRLTVMGYGEMSKRVRLSFNNTKAACHRLIAKLVIEEAAREVSDRRQGKTYRVFSYRAILDRRKASGMEWVIRNKGVEFVTPSSNGQTSISATLPVIDRVSETTTESLSKKGRGSPSKTGTLLGNSFREPLRESSSADIASLVQALTDYGQPDDDVAHNLFARCRSIAPDCTTAEIVHFVHEKGSLIRQDRTRRITSPMGFLLTAVPKCLTGETFERYRNQERSRLEQQRLLQERQQTEIDQWRREQEAILNDPSATEEDKQFARRVLGA